MPRIDPLELLKCLHVLLRDDGGIKSDSEVQRLASLMTRFSKKLVSKCIYVQILKRSETRLVGLFLGAGGWRLIHMWLQDGIVNQNWPLVQELLELLLLCPVNVELLKANNCPKLVKGLSRDESHEGVRLLAGKLVEQWLRIVKGESLTAGPEETATAVDQEAFAQADQFKIIGDNLQAESDINTLKKNNVLALVTSSEEVRTIEESSVETKECMDKTLSEVAQNEQVLNVHKADDSSTGSKLGNDSESISVSKDKESIIKESNKSKERRDKGKHSSSSSHKSSPKSSSSKHSSSKSSGSSSSSGSGSSSHRNKSSSRDKDRDKKTSHKSSSSSSSSRDKGRERDKDKDKEREKARDKDKDKVKEKDKDREKEREKNKQEEKDKATLDKLKPKTLDKLGKIPKRRTSDDEKATKVDSKKPSISIEVRKNEGTTRPKTVKTFNSKFRSHGLEEEAKPPPPRQVKKSSTSLPGPLPAVKRQSPPRYDSVVQPEKKAKLAEAPVQAKPGAIKLIPAKPKPALLMESDMFMDALSASATNKKEPRKRKRKLSASKDVETDQPVIKSSSPPQSPKPGESECLDVKSPSNADTTPAIPTNDGTPAVVVPAPPRFYQDTLENTDEEKEVDKIAEKTRTTSDEVHTPEYCEQEESEKEPKALTEVSTSAQSEDMSTLKGVLLYAKRKGPKKKVQWREETDLVDIQYFELDETERVNVTKTFTDMKQMERVNEREAFQLARKLPNEDTMEERTTWMILIPVDDVAPINFGKNSREKDIQYARERIVPPAMYYHRMMIPESPAEPDPQICIVTDPAVIPLDDITGNPDTVNDFQNTPWPEPKGNAPLPAITAPVTPFPAVPPMMPFPHGPGMPFPIPPFPGGPVPPFPMHGPTPDSMPPMTPDMMMNGGMFPPRMDGPPIDGNMMPMNGFGPPFGPQFNGPNGGGGFPGGGRGMRPMNSMGGGGPRCPPNTGWYRPPGSGPNGPGWQNGPRSKSWNNPRICRQFRKGYCNKGDNCSYLHPGINCPPL